MLRRILGKRGYENVHFIELTGFYSTADFGVRFVEA
jgi:hypothetical protein